MMLFLLLFLFVGGHGILLRTVDLLDCIGRKPGLEKEDQTQPARLKTWKQLSYHRVLQQIPGRGKKGKRTCQEVCQGYLNFGPKSWYAIRFWVKLNYGVWNQNPSNNSAGLFCSAGCHKWCTVACNKLTGSLLQNKPLSKLRLDV